MFTNTKKAAYWAAVIGLGTFVLFMLSFLTILFVNPPFTWNGMDAFVQYTKSNPQAFKYLGMLSMLLYSLIFVVIVLCERATLQNSGRLFADIAAGIRAGILRLYLPQLLHTAHSDAAADHARGFGRRIAVYAELPHFRTHCDQYAGLDGFLRAVYRLPISCIQNDGSKGSSSVLPHEQRVDAHQRLRIRLPMDFRARPVHEHWSRGGGL